MLRSQRLLLISEHSYQFAQTIRRTEIKPRNLPLLFSHMFSHKRIQTEISEQMIVFVRTFLLIYKLIKHQLHIKLIIHKNLKGKLRILLIILHLLEDIRYLRNQIPHHIRRLLPRLRSQILFQILLNYPSLIVIHIIEILCKRHMMLYL